MVLTRSQYENMSKEELIQDINSSFVNDINAKLTGLSEKFNEFTSKYDKVYSDLQQCKSLILIFSTELFNWSAMLLQTPSIAEEKQLK